MTTHEAIASKTLFDRLGGNDGVARLVEHFLDRFLDLETVRNPLVIRRREALYRPELTKHWIAFFTETAGGPKQYAGRTMRSAHAGMKISDADFDATIALMEESFAQSGIGQSEQRDLLRLMRDERTKIVERHSPRERVELNPQPLPPG
ncbi:MAG TPA: group 1 truncated hemoglobin [Gemmatimonadaceae bacterium]|nr:group 1 truncated hemoglobin [Gemmatimonadaceae bacterium]